MRFLPKIQKRAGIMSQNLDIRSDNSCPANRTSFFGNYQNKENFVKALARYLMDKFKVRAPKWCRYDDCERSLDVCKRISCYYIFRWHRYPMFVGSPCCNRSFTTQYPFNQHDTKKRETKRVLLYFWCLEETRECLTWCQSVCPCLYRVRHNIGCSHAWQNNNIKENTWFTCAETNCSPILQGMYSSWNKHHHCPVFWAPPLVIWLITSHQEIELWANGFIWSCKHRPFSSTANSKNSLLPWRDLKDSDDTPLDWGWQLKGQSFIPIMTDKEAGPQTSYTLYDVAAKVYVTLIDVLVVKLGWAVPHYVKNAMVLHVRISSSMMTWVRTTKSGSRHKNWCIARVLSFLIRYFSN